MYTNVIFTCKSSGIKTPIAEYLVLRTQRSLASVAQGAADLEQSNSSRNSEVEWDMN